MFRSSFDRHELERAVRSLDDGDKQILVRLASVSAVDQPHYIACYLYFATEHQAQQASDVLRSDDFSIEVRPGAQGSGWLALAHQMIVPHPCNIVLLRERLTELATSLGGEFDGWETTIVKCQTEKRIELSQEERQRLAKSFTPPPLSREQIERFARNITGRKTGTLVDAKARLVSPGDGITNEPVLRFSGSLASDGETVAWSALVKTVRDPDGVQTTDPGLRQLLDARKEPRSPEYWRRELDFMSNAYAAVVPKPSVLRLPRYYALVTTPTSSIMWLEEVQGEPATRWKPERFANAAYAMGLFSAGLIGNKAALEASFLARSAAAPRMQDRNLTINHLDLSPACMFADDAAHATVVANWAHAGLGPLGEDLAKLTFEPVRCNLIPVADLDGFEAAVVARYVAGARDARWTGDERIIRSAYAAVAMILYGGPVAVEHAESGDAMAKALLAKARQLEAECGSATA